MECSLATRKFGGIVCLVAHTFCLLFATITVTVHYTHDFEYIHVMYILTILLGKQLVIDLNFC